MTILLSPPAASGAATLLVRPTSVPYWGVSCVITPFSWQSRGDLSREYQQLSQPARRERRAVHPRIVTSGVSACLDWLTLGLSAPLNFNILPRCNYFAIVTTNGRFKVPHALVQTSSNPGYCIRLIHFFILQYNPSSEYTCISSLPLFCSGQCCPLP